MDDENNLQKNIGVFLGVVVMFGVLFVTFFFGKQASNTTVASQTTTANNSLDNTNTVLPNIPPVDTTNNSTTPPTKVVTQTPPVDTPKKSSSVYKDGTYSATGSYMSPGGYDQLGVSITLKNDIITNASITNMAGDGRSQRYQNSFISGYKQYVIGQNIANVYLSRVSGASLTPKGFNDALAQIKSQAVA